MSDEIGERVAVLETEQKSTAQILAQHVKHCSKIQTYGLAIGCVTFGVVASEHPKIAGLVGKVIEVTVGMFAG